MLIRGYMLQHRAAGVIATGSPAVYLAPPSAEQIAIVEARAQAVHGVAHSHADIEGQHWTKAIHVVVDWPDASGPFASGVAPCYMLQHRVCGVVTTEIPCVFMVPPSTAQIDHMRERLEAIHGVEFPNPPPELAGPHWLKVVESTIDAPADFAPVALSPEEVEEAPRDFGGLTVANGVAGRMPVVIEASGVIS